MSQHLPLKAQPNTSGTRLTTLLLAAVFVVPVAGAQSPPPVAQQIAASTSTASAHGTACPSPAGARLSVMVVVLMAVGGARGPSRI